MTSFFPEVPQLDTISDLQKFLRPGRRPPTVPNAVARRRKTSDDTFIYIYIYIYSVALEPRAYYTRPTVINTNHDCRLRDGPTFRRRDHEQQCDMICCTQRTIRIHIVVGVYYTSCIRAA